MDDQTAVDAATRTGVPASADLPAPRDHGARPAPTDGAGPRVAVIGGGRSCEHDVSRATARSVAEALVSRGADVVRLTIGTDGTWSDDRGPLGATSAASLAAAVALLGGCDVAFPAVHGPHGEDGTLAALLDLAGVAYVGSGVRGGALAMDKWATKLVARELGIAVADGRLVDVRSTVSVPDASFPVVVKPVAAGSSHGVSVAHDVGSLHEAVTLARAVDPRVLLEEFVVGREIDVAVLETGGSRLVGPPLEIIVAAGGVFDTASKYDDAPDFLLPASVSPTEHACLREAALALFDALGCGGVARFDFFLSAEHGLVLNEVNTMPGMTPTSQVPKMFAALGIPYEELVETLVLEALGTPRALLPAGTAA
ncbi:D-alanine--D-alanine ligase family protein [Oerskovia enterophila]